MPANHNEIEKKLWASADELRANSHLKSSEYSVPVLGLIFLRFADQRFGQVERELTATVHVGSRRTIGKADYQARGVMYLPPQARFSFLLRLPEGENIGKAINEYFLGKFAMSEGQKGGEFFTPTSIVKLIVEIIEPFQGRIFDPACGSGGMFVQSARFVQNHQHNPGTGISIYGQEKTAETVRLCRMNLAVHGLSGDIRQANSYYENVHNCRGRFDFVMANPPLNVDGVDKEKIKDDPRYPFGLPRVDNANYLWIQEFYSALNEHGRAGFVMANSASDARASELDIRHKLIEAHVIDVMISIGSNFFYTVTLPCTLWFFDKAKRNTVRRDKVLFIDARHIFTQIDRAHREFTPEQIEFLANIVRLYSGEAIETISNSAAHIQDVFPTGTYADVPGLCKVATLQEIEAQGWSINSGRYVGVAERAVDDFDFKERLEALNEELEVLNAEARELEQRISENVAMLLEEV
jgi:type I restriction enzyme M protein